MEGGRPVGYIYLKSLIEDLSSGLSTEKQTPLGPEPGTSGLQHQRSTRPSCLLFPSIA